LVKKNVLLEIGLTNLWKLQQDMDYYQNFTNIHKDIKNVNFMDKMFITLKDTPIPFGFLEIKFTFAILLEKTEQWLITNQQKKESVKIAKEDWLTDISARPHVT
jgi:hypothetical protein